MGHSHFLNSTCDIGENKRQRHETLSFFKVDMQHQGSLGETFITVNPVAVVDLRSLDLLHSQTLTFD